MEFRKKGEVHSSLLDAAVPVFIDMLLRTQIEDFVRYHTDSLRNLVVGLGADLSLVRNRFLPSSISSLGLDLHARRDGSALAPPSDDFNSSDYFDGRNLHQCPSWNFLVPSEEDLLRLHQIRLAIRSLSRIAETIPREEYMGVVAHFGRTVDIHGAPQRGAGARNEYEFLELGQSTAYWGATVDYQQLQSPAYAHMDIPEHAGAPLMPPPDNEFPLGKSRWEECFNGP